MDLYPHLQDLTDMKPVVVNPKVTLEQLFDDFAQAEKEDHQAEIRDQILVAAGIPLSGKNYFPKLHSLECRINAEDPYNGFRPSPGKITNLHAPGGHGVRIDTHVYSGYSIPPNYDSMIAKLITTAQTREEAINKMKRALDEFVIEGVKTTIPFHRQLMDHPDYLDGNYTTKFMEDFKMDAIKEE